MAKTLTFAGVNYLPYYKTNTAKIKETLRKTNVMNLEIVTKGIANAPQEGSEVVFKDGSRFLFGGYISRVQALETGKGQLFNFDVEVSDYSYIFNSKTARRSYSNKTLLYIVTDLMGEYVASSYGFDITNVATGPTIDTVSFNHISMKAALDKLAKITGYVWWVDYEMKLYFTTQTATAAPEAVTDSSGNIDSLNISYDTSQVRNSVTVIGNTGGVESLATISETFTANSATRSWELTESPSTVSSITVNGVSKQFSLDVNERSSDIFIYSFSGKSFRQTDAQATLTTETIVITYYPRIPIIEELTDPTSIAFFAALDSGDGVYESTINDSSIGSLEEANARALQELEEFSMPLASGKITTRSGLLASPTNVFKAGQYITITSATQGLASATTFLIQEMQIEVIDGSSTEYIYTIIFGGKVVGIQEFLEILAAQQAGGSADTTTDTEIITIEHVTDSLQFSDTDVAISKVNQTPPFKWKTGSPQGVWSLSEWK